MGHFNNMSNQSKARKAKKLREKKLSYDALEDRKLLAVGNLGYTGWSDNGPSSTQEMGKLADAFTNSPEADSWSLWWNAPNGWSTDTAGNLATGEIGNIDSYRPLKKQSGTNTWTVDGDDIGNNGAPGEHLRASPTVWHPGFAYNGTSSHQDRFVIASFTASESGFYKFKDLKLNVDSSSTDGVELYVHVENEFRFNNIHARGSNGTFSNDIGYVAAGDRIFVAVGGYNQFNSDRFTPSFTLERVLPRDEPLRSLPGKVTNKTITTRNPYGSIKAALANLKENQKIKFNYQGSGSVVTLNAPADAPEDYFFELVRKKNVEIDLNGLELRLNDRTRAFMRISSSENVIIKNGIIDYTDQQLPFTQGKVIDVQSKHVDFVLSPGFVSPVQYGNPGASDFNDNSEFKLNTYAVSTDGSGRIIGTTGLHYTPDPTAVHRLTKLDSTSNVYRLKLHAPEGLRKDDGIVVQARKNRALFGIYHASKQVTFSNITVYSAPSTFIGSSHATNINVIDSKIDIRPGRWKSINADAVHIQSSRDGGAWVENSVFNGAGDDIMNFYTSPLVFTGLPSQLTATTWKAPVKQAPSHAPGFDNLLPVTKDVVKEGDEFTIYEPIFGTSRATQPDQFATVVGWDLDAAGKITHLHFDGIAPKQTGTPAPGTGAVVTPSDDDVRDNWTLYNRSVSKSAVVIGNQFLNSKRHGIYVMSSQTQILDNTFSGLAGQAVAGRNETGWPLGSFANSVLVQGNMFSDNGTGRKAMDEEFQSGDVSFLATRYLPDPDPTNSEDESIPDVFLNKPWYYYKNLEIRDNVFYHWRKAAITVRNARNVNIVGNTILAPQKFHDLDDTDDGTVNYDPRDPNRFNDNTAIRLSYSATGAVSDNYTADLGINRDTLNELGKKFYFTPGFEQNNFPTGTNVPNVSISQLKAWFKFDRRLYDSQLSGIATDSSIDAVNKLTFWKAGSRRNFGGTGNPVVDPAVNQYSRIGQLEYAAWFDGAQNGITINSADNINNNVASKRTVGMWVNMTGTVKNSAVPRVIYEEGNATRGFNMYVQKQKVYVGAWDGGWSTFLEMEASTGWHHMAFVLNASDTSTTPQDNAFKAFMDGTVMDQGSGKKVGIRGGHTGLGMNSGNSRIASGSAATMDLFQGYLDDVRIYNRALSNADVAALAFKRNGSAWDFEPPIARPQVVESTRPVDSGRTNFASSAKQNMLYQPQEMEQPTLAGSVVADQMTNVDSFDQSRATATESNSVDDFSPLVDDLISDMEFEIA